MTENSKESQAEPQTERVAVMVTPSEKRAVRFVADAKAKSESEVMRTFSIDEIVAEYDRIRAILNAA
jgi:hypothetical protein